MEMMGGGWAGYIYINKLIFLEIQAKIDGKSGWISPRGENAHAGLLHSMSAFDNLSANVSANVSANISANGTLRAVANATVEDMLKEMAQQQAIDRWEEGRVLDVLELLYWLSQNVVGKCGRFWDDEFVFEGCFDRMI